MRRTETSRRAILASLLALSVLFAAASRGSQTTAQVRPRQRPSASDVPASPAASPSACAQVDAILSSGRVSNPRALRSLQTFRERCRDDAGQDAAGEDAPAGAPAQEGNRQTPPSQSADAALERENAELTAKLAAADRRIEELEGQLRAVLRKAAQMSQDGASPMEQDEEETPPHVVSAEAPQAGDVHSAAGPKGPCSIVRRVMGWMGLGDGC